MPYLAAPIFARSRTAPAHDAAPCGRMNYMTRPPPDPHSPADTERTTALPRRPPGDAKPDPGAAPDLGPAYQETTVLRRPPREPVPSNVPGADRPRGGSNLPPYAGPDIPPRLAGVDAPELPPAPTGGEGYRDGERQDAASYPYGPPTVGPPVYGGAYDAAPPTSTADATRHAGLRRRPRKLTVTRVAALRSRELTHRGIEKFHGAVSADGADRSGLSQLTYAVMGNYAVDAALAVALANTLFFAAAKAESTGKVLLYLLLTVAPFAVIAPLIGPALDRLQRGRRIALAASSVGRAILAVVMALNFDSWIIYPCALGMLVLSKGFGVLKAALTPRVLPEAITLVKTNSRMTVFGLIAGGVSGGIAAGISALTTSAGALWFVALCGIVGAWLCLLIPSWVESTEGEVPIHHTGAMERPPAGDRRTAHAGRTAGAELAAGAERAADAGPTARARRGERRGLPQKVVQTLWANSTIRIETGFLALFIAFVIKTRYQTAPVTPTPGVALGAGTDDQSWMQLLLLGAIGAAAGAGGFIGNALGARLPLKTPETVALWCVASVIASVLLAFLVPGLITAGAVALVGSTSSSLAKVCLDATIQTHLPEASRASAFGRSESVLQLSWVFGGVIGLLIGGIWALGGDTVYRVGFGVVGLLLLAGLAQCIAVRMGRTLVPAWRSLWSLVRRGSGRDSGPGRAAARAETPAATGTVATPGAVSPADGSNSARRTRAARSPYGGAGPDGSAGRVGSAGPERHTRKAGRPR
jgi:MFS family permease